jgi:hypothetical protein
VSREEDLLDVKVLILASVLVLARLTRFVTEFGLGNMARFDCKPHFSAPFPDEPVPRLGQDAASQDGSEAIDMSAVELLPTPSGSRLSRRTVQYSGIVR